MRRRFGGGATVSIIQTKMVYKSETDESGA